jgi:hypothetical protein
MRTPPRTPAKHVAVTIVFEPTRFAPDYLQAASAVLIAPGLRRASPTPERRQRPIVVPNLGVGAGDESASRGPRRAGLVRATG